MTDVERIPHLVAGVFGLLLVAAATLALSHRLRLPFTVLLVVVGILLKELTEAGPEVLREILQVPLSEGLILYVFLPTLIFESALNLNARHLRQNIGPVVTLAIPGLLLSTGLLGVILWGVTDLGLPLALLLGAILSATDPVAVIALFKQLGAPKRLTVLVEGESLFNDATAVVLANILKGVVLAGVITWGTLAGGAGHFLMEFVGGTLVGLSAALITGYVLGRVESDRFIEISLTMVLAYLSFLIADQLHFSGVMAVVAAGVTMGGWGRTKISPSVAGHLVELWEYLAYLANALIFLLVGLRVNLGALWASKGTLIAVIVAMLISRAVVIYGLVPLVGILPNSATIDRRYQTVMYWGGLRGAIALAIVLSLPATIGDTDRLVALVTGAVLFTLIVQGFSMEALVRRLRLDEPPLSDRLARAKGTLSAKRRAMDRIPELQKGGLFSKSVAEMLRSRTEKGILETRKHLDMLRQQELDAGEERRLLFLACLSAEKTAYYDLFGNGHLSETSYRELAHSIEVQSEAIRHQGALPHSTLHPPGGSRPRFWRLFDRLIPGSERARMARVARDYEETWGRYQACQRVLAELAEIGQSESSLPEVIAEVRGCYQNWLNAARCRLDETAEQFPEFVTEMQKRLACRLVAHAEKEAIEEEARSGNLPPGVAESLSEELSAEVRSFRGGAVARLHVDPQELLRTVPFFSGTPPDEFSRVTALLRARTFPSGEVIIAEGQTGDSLYLISRGVIRVSVTRDGTEHDLATLMAGDFFGEMALLSQDPRRATCRAVTPCALYELRRADFDEIRSSCPQIQVALEEARQLRAAVLDGNE